MSVLGVRAKKSREQFKVINSQKFTYYMVCVSYEKKMNKKAKSKIFVARSSSPRPEKVQKFL